MRWDWEAAGSVRGPGNRVFAMGRFRVGGRAGKGLLRNVWAPLWGQEQEIAVNDDDGRTSRLSDVTGRNNGKSLPFVVRWGIETKSWHRSKREFLEKREDLRRKVVLPFIFSSCHMLQADVRSVYLQVSVRSGIPDAAAPQRL